jgi:hypothetical protein
MALKALPSGVQGHASFSDETPPLRRHYLERRWSGPIRDDRFLLWIGHNPSIANHLMNDPTVEKECKFTNAFGYKVYRKLNLSDWISTDPDELLRLSLRELFTPENKARIMREARKADKVICCWGHVHPSLKVVADTVEAMLRTERSQLWTLVLNLDASPKHPLYIKDDTPLCLFRADRTAFKRNSA